MSKKKIFLIGLCVLFLSLSSLAHAQPKILPIFNLRISAGSADFTGKAKEKLSSSFNGDFALDFVPVVRFNELFSILPRYSGSYTGVGSVMELEDKKILYQQAQNHLLSLRLLYKLSPSLGLKGEYGFKKELLRETKNESWNEGLYDYNNNFFSLEMEKRFSRFLIGGGSRIYTLYYPNYQSLASKAGKTELAGGKDVLDTDNLDVFLEGDILLGEGSMLSWGLLLTHSAYIDKKVLIDESVYSSDKRADTILDFNCGVTYPLGSEQYDTFLELDIDMKIKDSNENYYDTENYKIISDFYDYNQLKITPSVIVKSLVRNVTLIVAWELVRREYPNRMTSTPNAGGSFKYGVNSDTQVWRMSILYPISRGICLDTSYNWRNSSSDVDYEPEKYNFETYSYLIGISYEY